MSCKIEINDDFDPEKIRESGQCFRVSRLDDGAFRFIASDKIVVLRPLGEGEYEASCDQSEWERFWVPYFDMSKNYSEIRTRSKGKNAFVDEAMSYGKGLRILTQDPWEMLITFIISQRKNMPAIANAVETLSERFGSIIECDGRSVVTDDDALGHQGRPFDSGDDAPSSNGGTFDSGDDAPCSNGGSFDSGDDQGFMIHAFPTPEQLAQASEEELRACSLGYRAPYVLAAARSVASGEIDLQALSKLSDEELFEELKRFHGVGAKVANCICLFGYGRTSQVPIDVWIARAIDEECGGNDPFIAYGEDAGVMQQYVFYYMTDRNRKERRLSAKDGRS